VEPEIRPEPSPEERAAILAALEELRRNGAVTPYRSGWREEGIRENVEDGGDRSGLLHDGPATQQAGRKPRVVEA
jgi:hypothetical protein